MDRNDYYGGESASLNLTQVCMGYHLMVDGAILTLGSLALQQGSTWQRSTQGPWPRPRLEH